MRGLIEGEAGRRRAGVRRHRLGGHGLGAGRGLELRRALREPGGERAPLRPARRPAGDAGRGRRRTPRCWRAPAAPGGAARARSWGRPCRTARSGRRWRPAGPTTAPARRGRRKSPGSSEPARGRGARRRSAPPRGGGADLLPGEDGAAGGPGVVGGAHRGRPVRLGGGEVVQLGAVGLQVVELPAPGSGRPASSARRAPPGCPRAPRRWGAGAASPGRRRRGAAGSRPPAAGGPAVAPPGWVAPAASRQVAMTSIRWPGVWLMPPAGMARRPVGDQGGGDAALVDPVLVERGRACCWRWPRGGRS